MSPRNDPRTPADLLAMQSEADFHRALIELAHLNHWKTYHTYDSRKSTEGFPDLLLVSERFKWTIFVELKKETGQATPAQLEWLRVLRAAGNDARLWRPSDWPEIESILTGRAYGSPHYPYHAEAIDPAIETDGSYQGGRP